MAQGNRPEPAASAAGPSSAPERAAGALLVERITHQDVPAVCALYKKVLDAEASGLPTPIAKSWQPTPLEFTSWMEGVTYFAARRDGRVVGVVGCETVDGSAHLVRLAVDPEARRQGVATALLQTTLDWARRASLPAVWADVLDRFRPAAALFRHAGFSEVGLLHKRCFHEDVRFFERVL